jgi:bla regulator protein BlaR1
MASASYWLEAIFFRILEISWQATVLVLLIAVVQGILRETLGARCRYALWGLLFVRLVIPQTVSSPFSMHGFVRDMLRAASIHSAVPSLPQSTFSMDAVAVGGTTFAQPEYALSWWQAAAWVWLAGVLCAVGVAALQSLRLRRLVAQAQPCTAPSVLALLDECKEEMHVTARVEVVAATHLDGPALLGWLRPRLLLPEALLGMASTEHLRYVILHELAHLKRRDIFTGWVAYLLAGVHWFNPVLWWARKRCTADRELACDSSVLAAIGIGERASYGHAILDQYQRSRSFVWSLALAGVLDGNTNIERRIEMISRSAGASSKTTILAITVAALLSIPILTDAQDKPAGSSEPSAHYFVLPESASAPVAVPIKDEKAAPPKDDVKSAPQTPLPDASGPIGVYDKKLILKSWKKYRESYDELRADVAERQRGIDALSEAIEQEKKAYESAKSGLSEDERSSREAKIKKMYADYRKRLDGGQDEITNKEKEMISAFTADLTKAAGEVGKQMGCIAVEPFRDKRNPSPGSDASQTSAETIDITARVLTVLNKD